MPSEINLKPTGSYFEIAQSNLPISGRTWGTPADCHSAALLVHGLGANSAWFEALGRRLKVKGVFALSFDQIGFGKRQGQNLASYRQWLDDVEKVWQYLKSLIGDKPTYLLGNSAGAAVALASANKVKPDGLILCSPGFEGHPRTFNLIFRLSSIVRALLQPESFITLPYTVDMVSRDQASISFMESEAGKRMTVKASIMLELLKLARSTVRQTTTVNCPTLMLTAGRDSIVSNAVNTEVFDQLNAPKKTRRHYAEAYHDLFFDPVIDEVSDELVNWIREYEPSTVNIP